MAMIKPTDLEIAVIYVLTLTSWLIHPLTTRTMDVLIEKWKTNAKINSSYHMMRPITPLLEEGRFLTTVTNINQLLMSLDLWEERMMSKV